MVFRLAFQNSQSTHHSACRLLIESACQLRYLGFLSELPSHRCDPQVHPTRTMLVLSLVLEIGHSISQTLFLVVYIQIVKHTDCGALVHLSQIPTITASLPDLDFIDHRPILLQTGARPYQSTDLQLFAHEDVKFCLTACFLIPVLVFLEKLFVGVSKAIGVEHFIHNYIASCVFC